MDGCGLSYWRPRWLQKYAKPGVFILFNSLFETIQFAGVIYLNTTITTLEKQFKIPSKTTGIILSGKEISQVTLSLILTYFGGRKNIPKWLSFGAVCYGLSYFIVALSHFIYGAGEEVLQYTQEYSSWNQTISSEVASNPNRPENSKICQNSTILGDDSDEELLYVPLILIFLSRFVLGIGWTLFFSLGTTYIDNSVKGCNFPLIFSCRESLRSFGPILGFCFAYVMLRIFVAPTLTPLIPQDDHRWIGAWWLGCIIIALLTFFFAGIFGLFPRSLKKEETSKNAKLDREKLDNNTELKPKIEGNKNGVMKDFQKAIWRLLTNKFMMLNCFGEIFHVLKRFGFTIFMGRMMEVQFNKTAAGGSAFTGLITNIAKAIGMMLAGIIITKYKPNASSLYFWNVFIGLITLCCMISYTQLGCDNNHSLLLNQSIVSCNDNCNCEDISYSPVCDLSTSTTYFSACHAGCKTFDEKYNVYNNCSCTEGASNELQSKEHQVASGGCVENCDSDYYAYTFISMISYFLSSTTTLSFFLISIRSVEPQDKALAQGFMLFMSSLFGSIPCPIIFGYIIDSTCLIWNYKGGQQGNCLLYDPVKFRHYFHSARAFFLVTALCFDFMIGYYGKHLDLYCDSGEGKGEITKKQKDDSHELEPLKVQQLINK
ncbi:solute carrier organic anion transporter family member 74D-like [Contarinia nasturtii]|uniref:solute carrier organic anion transporter family member 74D-like n=1 Tax=Contarinia nasturtii TaxID=265458 RepID=UPI0012D3D1D0|nr:solute carrier organic anion transporter family member 74D-like [Contarinia nasturtii]